MPHRDTSSGYFMVMFILHLFQCSFDDKICIGWMVLFRIATLHPRLATFLPWRHPLNRRRSAPQSSLCRPSDSSMLHRSSATRATKDDSQQSSDIPMNVLSLLYRKIPIGLCVVDRFSLPKRSEGCCESGVQGGVSQSSLTPCVDHYVAGTPRLLYSASIRRCKPSVAFAGLIHPHPEKLCEPSLQHQLTVGHS